MPLSAEQRRTRALDAADARHHPGASRAELDARRFDQHADAIGEIVARAGRMTPEQAAKIGRLFTYIDPAASG